MHGVDDLIDVGRLFMFVLSCWCCYILIKRFRAHNNDWNTKTKDYWYSMFAWCVSGIVLMSQGILLNRPLTPATVVVTAAVLVTGKGLHKKGSWGGDDE